MLTKQPAVSYPTNLGDLDQHEFSALTEPHRRELQVHCYRMLGSLQDAEDLVQEALLRAWRGRNTFRQPGSFRAWLYKIATNACLNALAKRPRRTLPFAAYPVAEAGEPMAPPIEELYWLEPFPDEWLAEALESPEARYSVHESITLAFLTALQLLPPHQRAVLILRDVLDWQASEVAELLELTVSAVNSALHRARATIAKHYPEPRRETAQATASDATTRQLLERYVQAWETADVAGLISLLKEDAAFTMPPIPTWYRGPEAIALALAHGVFTGGRQWRLQRTQANGRPALATYEQAEAGKVYQAFTLQLLTVDSTSGRIAELVNFLNPAFFARFGLPIELEAG